jgi:hypothetical protein
MLDKKLRMGVAAMAAVLALTFAVMVGPVAADTSSTTAVPVAALDATAVAGQVTAQEAAGLIKMREEEKLARDVYNYLYQTWGLSIFKNIAASEQTHTSAIKTLLDRYQIADPVTDNSIGVFADPALQALFNDLISQGTQSLASALQVGIAIEKLDISDLQAELALTTKIDITTVYQNLLRGSQNHLRSFTANTGRR